jgi:two-component sensor histidine kinase
VEAELRSRIEALEAARAEAEERVRDIEHRARNDLQLIWSILVMQARRTPEGPARQAIRRAADRMAAVAAVQRRLPGLGEPLVLDCQPFLRDLVGEIAAASGRADVRVVLELDSAPIAPRQAAPLGLIAEELVHNALAHAFPDRQGQVEVSLRRDGSAAVLIVSDDGVGTGGDAGPEPGFGLTLVDLLCKQLHGEIRIGRAETGGVQAVLRFPESG